MTSLPHFDIIEDVHPTWVQKGAQRLISKPQTVTSIQEEYASAIVETTATPKFKDILFYSATKYYM